MTTRSPVLRSIIRPAVNWIDSWAGDPEEHLQAPNRPDWPRLAPLVALHAICFGVLWVGWSPIAVGVAVALYWMRMFAITAFFHRGLSHRAFKTSRVVQFLFAALGTASCQRGPIWWAAHHRKHHRHSDHEADVHSPVRHSFIWSHIGWFTTRPNFPTDLSVTKDLAKLPELRFLDRFNMLPPLALALGLFGLGEALAVYAPGLGTNGWQMFIWGFAISTTVLIHCTCAINSLAHRMGSRRYETDDESRNSLFLALITMGEGWHNNHHHYPGSARQGFRWWEIDLTHMILVLMGRLGLVWDLRPVPQRALESRLAARPRRPGLEGAS